MKRDTYHHGELKQELIHKGLLLLNKNGVEGFSLRKVASMCGVSHNAPYKHFKDKDELINEIFREVWSKFGSSLLEVINSTDNNKTQIIEIGKAYVKFMVENPEYLKLMFLSDNNFSTHIKNNEFKNYKSDAFEVFKNSTERYFDEINLDKSLYVYKTVSMWSLVHGISILIVKNNIVYDGNYIDFVENMIESVLN